MTGGEENTFFRYESFSIIFQCFYKQLATDPTLNTIRRINTILQEMFDQKHIYNDTFNYLQPLQKEAKAGRFYMLPKIHKTGNPGRPIVSANSHPTEKISEFVDHHLRPHVKELPSYIQDTTDYLKKMGSLNSLPNNTILASMDVSSLYNYNYTENQGQRSSLKKNPIFIWRNNTIDIFQN